MNAYSEKKVLGAPVSIPDDPHEDEEGPPMAMMSKSDLEEFRRREKEKIEAIKRMIIFNSRSKSKVDGFVSGGLYGISGGGGGHGGAGITGMHHSATSSTVSGHTTVYVGVPYDPYRDPYGYPSPHLPPLETEPRSLACLSG